MLGFSPKLLLPLWSRANSTRARLRLEEKRTCRSYVSAGCMPLASCSMQGPSRPRHTTIPARTHGSDDVRARVITWTGIRDKARAAARPKIYFTPAYAFTFLRSNLPASHFPLWSGGKLIVFLILRYVMSIQTSVKYKLVSTVLELQFLCQGCSLPPYEIFCMTRNDKVNSFWVRLLICAVISSYLAIRFIKTTSFFLLLMKNVLQDVKRIFLTLC